MERAIFYSDSLFKIETSDQFMGGKILLLTAQTEHELKNSRIILHQNKLIIRNQRWSIIVLVGSVFIVLVFLAIVIIQRKKLNDAYHILVERTMHTINTGQQQAIVKSGQDSTEQSLALLRQLENLMTVDKHFLDPELSISKLSRLIGTNEKYLSQLFNQQLNTTFNDYINGLRIKEACLQMVLPEIASKSMDQIAADAGFGARSTFYYAFKKYTGVTPAFFIKSNLKKRS
jgi:AraC-like DNA-binding protein